MYAVGDWILNCTVSPGWTLVWAGKPLMSPYALGANHSSIGVPGLEFSQTIAFVVGPQGSAAPATAAGGRTVAIRAATTVKRP